MIENAFPHIPVHEFKACPHQGCEYKLAVEWWAQDGPRAWVTMPRPQMEWLLQRHLEHHLDPTVRHA